MNLGRLRATFLDQVRAEADQAVELAESERSARLAEAQREASRLIADARAAGARDAAEEAARIEAVARRQARGRILAARRELYEELRAAVLRETLLLRGSKRYEALLERLAATARDQLGAATELEIDPAGSGGLIARDGARLVDYTLPALTERCIAVLGSRVEELWR